MSDEANEDEVGWLQPFVEVVVVVVVFVMGVTVNGGVFGFGLVRRRVEDENETPPPLDDEAFISLKSIINSST